MIKREDLIYQKLVELFGEPCNFPDSEDVMNNKAPGWCKEYCGKEYVKCWEKYFDTIEEESKPAETKIRNVLIDEGQSNSKKYGFKLGETIKFNPVQVEEILARRKKEWQ